MTEVALALAHEARRMSLIDVLRRQQRTLTLERLDVLLRETKYGDELGRITVGELHEVARTGARRRASKSVIVEIVRVFRAQPEVWLSSGFFVKHLGLHRWTAQAMLAELAKRGVLLREGKTSGTRYRLARGSTRGG